MKQYAQVQRRNPFRLTRREIEILKLISAGAKSKTIAEKLGLSIRTVETHRYNLLKKTGTNNTITLLLKLAPSVNISLSQAV